jgi:hypothetical protein
LGGGGGGGRKEILKGQFTKVWTTANMKIKKIFQILPAGRRENIVRGAQFSPVSKELFIAVIFAS